MEDAPMTIHARWNKDLTITLRAGGRKVFRTRKGSALSPKETIQVFLDGWFGGKPHRVRWTFA
jgi:hypothetical protein